MYVPAPSPWWEFPADHRQLLSQLECVIASLLHRWRRLLNLFLGSIARPRSDAAAGQPSDNVPGMGAGSATLPALEESFQAPLHLRPLAVEDAVIDGVADEAVPEDDVLPQESLAHGAQSLDGPL